MDYLADEGGGPATPHTPAAPAPEVAERTIGPLRATRPWVRLVSILMFVGVGIMVLTGLVLMVGLSFLPIPEDGVPGVLRFLPGFALGGIYVAASLLYLFPAIYLSRYAGAIARLQATRAAPDLERALSQQKSFWKFVGVLTVVGMILTALAVAAAIAVPLILLLLGKGGDQTLTM